MISCDIDYDLQRERCGTEAGYHTIALPINLMNISAVTIFFGQGSKKYSLKPGSMKTRDMFSRISSTKPSTLDALPVITAPVQSHLYSSPPSHNPSRPAYVVHKVLQTRKYPLDGPYSKRWCGTLHRTCGK